MKRDISALSSSILDVLVVGGGIHGATIAYHAAMEGYRTAIVDKNDFCSGTSANSLKILHGGLRYLQHGNVKRMRHSILSRREMMHLAPYLVRPLPCIMPLYGRGLRGKLAMRTALGINDLVSWDRNQGLPEEIQLPKGYIVSEEKCREVIPAINREGLHGAAVWYDVLALDTERLVLEYILESTRYGARAANYAEVSSIVEADNDYAVTLVDRFDKSTHLVLAKFIVNASGPWFEKCFCSTTGQGMGEKQQWSMALNLVSRKKIFEEFAVALEGQNSYQDKDALIKRNKRLYFFVPWRGYTMIGTEYEASQASPDNLKIEQETVQKMVDEINAIYPPAKLQYGDISFFHAGLLPMQNSSDAATVQLEKNSTFAPCTNEKWRKVLSLKSVKYTTAPYVAHEVVGHIRRKLPPATSSVQSTIIEKDGSGNDIHPELRDMLAKRYGPRSERICKYEGISQSEESWIGSGFQVLKAELDYLVAEEMACTLSDVVLRRTGMGTAECPGEDLLQEMSSYMGNILGWNETREKEEVEEVLRRYHPLITKKSTEQ